MTKLFAIVLLAVALVAPGFAGAEDAAKAPTTAPAPDASGPSKFYGTVTAVDTKAMTFTVEKQVYHVVAETHMTKADDPRITWAGPAPLAGARVDGILRGMTVDRSEGRS